MPLSSPRFDSLRRSLLAFRVRLVGRAELASLARRVTYFWVVWSALLLVHEAGHALSARQAGLDVRAMTVGLGPVLWRGERADTKLALRLLPLAGVTDVAGLEEEARPAGGEPVASGRMAAWRAQLLTLAGGVAATLALGVVAAGAVLTCERITAQRWTLGRYVVADAFVLTIFNFLPVPPLDGGRALLDAFVAWRGPLPREALFWVQVGGLALAVAPMAFWTRWTARIDAAALQWGAPRPAGASAGEGSSQESAQRSRRGRRVGSANSDRRRDAA